MMIENIEERELTASERDVLAADRERWENRLASGSHLDEWLAFGTGLMIRRRMAMRAAFVNRPEGRGYVEVFNRIMIKDGFYQDNPKNPKEETRTRTTMTAVLWLHDLLERLQILRELRDAMSPGERARLNSPTTARQHVEKEIARREAEARKSKAAESGNDELPIKEKRSAAQRIAELERELADARTKLATAESLFDLKLTPPKEMAPVIAANMGEDKWRQVKAETDAAFKRKRQRPAG